MAATAEDRRHTIVALVDNEPGVLARVIGLFSGRGYNIESLTVAQVDKVRGLSRINIVTTGSEFVIEQIKSLLAKLVPVRRVQDLTAEGPHVERELALVKVIGDRERLIGALRLADFMHARLVDSMPGSFVFEVTGTSDELDAFIDLLEPAEVSRAGVVAIGRGENKGRTVTYANVVRRWVKLGDWVGAGKWTIPLSDVKTEMVDSIAVIVQVGSSGTPGVIRGAAIAQLQ